jgi:hypothetical protein
MNNIKTLLKEELALNDRRKLLSEESIISINNPQYIKYTLGIDLPINENYSLSIRKQIIEEQIIIESILGSINNYIGVAYDKTKEKTLEVVNSIKSLKDIAKFFKDILVDSELMKVAIDSIKKSLSKTMATIKDATNKILDKLKVSSDGFNDKFAKLIEHVENVAKNLSSNTGWAGFLMLLAFTTLLVYLEKTFIRNMMEKGVDFISKNTNIIGSVSDVLNSFKELKNLVSSLDIKPILSWFTDIGVDIAIGGVFTAIDIINLISQILAPIIKTVEWSVKLRKKVQ